MLLLRRLGLAIMLATPASFCLAQDYPRRPVDISQVNIADGFWAERMETNRRVTVPYDFAKCEETGRIGNFAKAGGLAPGDFQGIEFDDSDVFKVIEGASYALVQRPDAELEQYLDELIATIAAAQEEDGYLYTFRSIHPGRSGRIAGPERWSNLRSSHELYNVGHMYEAAVAYYQATGKRSLLDVATRNADLVDRVFGPDGRHDVPGHQEIEIGLVKLYRVTQEPRYLKLAQFFVDQRGKAEHRELYGEYSQDHKPLVEQQEAVGHAVRAVYYYAGATDIAALTGDASMTRAVDRLWQDVVSSKLAITGGIGARRAGEAFGDAYELPNHEAYNETCAAIANALWNQRLFLLHGEGKYVDVLERVIYNGFLSGVSLEGDRFFYPNPLASDGHTRFNHGSVGRQPWFTTSCCPVNIVRFMPSLAGLSYATDDDGLYVNLFMPSHATVEVAGHKVQLVQETDYPWQGDVRIAITPTEAAPFTLRVRIPGWARGQAVPSNLYQYANQPTEQVALRLNGEQIEPQLEKGYAVLKRRWQPGDVVHLQLPMPIRRVLPHGEVEACRGRVALERGPIVYCLEAVDHQRRVSNMSLPDESALQAEHRPGLLGGVTVLTGEALAKQRDDSGAVQIERQPLLAIPYYAWAHRELGEMAVWLPRDVELAEVAPLPTVASQARPSASHVWQNDTVVALHDQKEPDSSSDHSIPRFTWWPRQGSSEWVAYQFDQAQQVSQASVYWFDDTGIGQCRVPQSWQIQWHDGSSWQPVASVDSYTVVPNQYNTVQFERVRTDQLRLVVQLRPEFSAGILEWKVQ